MTDAGLRVAHRALRQAITDLASAVRQLGETIGDDQAGPSQRHDAQAQLVQAIRSWEKAVLAVRGACPGVQ